MGNCLFGGMGEVNEVIKVATSNGGIMEFYAPITVECIIHEFPGHGIFRSHDLFWKPLAHQEVLLAGESYYLLPLSNTTSCIGGVRSIAQRSYTEVFSRYNNGGFWKVKLVISPEQLLEILSQETRTQELIESVRTVAKCGSGVSSVGFSDQWSFSSSRNASSSKKDVLLEF
ncbi:hypothetical protein F0562_007818 [Nyssa sinensis]|uniref:Uncharacterized protein n=1 Tax=Nyssa sinensis TaxID=561372 RepID=A0A5J5A897_9ASTE|nr:hypothetical protein F0562_007818 [Nyssa sinensis]